MDQKRLWSIIALSLFLIFDRFFKWLAIKEFPKEIKILPQAFHFGLYPNSYLFFILDLPLFLSLGVIFASLVLLFIFFREQKPKDPLPFYFLFAGALSNFYDRAVNGAVIDYFIFFQWTSLNLADLLILFGCLKIFFSKKR
jgi:signal peptidase II